MVKIHNFYGQNICSVPQTLKRQHEDGREYKSPFLRQPRLWTTPLLEKNPAHQTQYFKVEIVKNQVQIDRRLCWLWKGWHLAMTI